MPPTRNSHTWVLERKNNSTLLRELQCSPGKNTRDEDGREGFESLSGTAGDCICVKQIRERAPVTKKEIMPNFPFSTMLAKGSALQMWLVSPRTGVREEDLTVEGRLFFRRQAYSTFAIHTSVSGLNTYRTVYKYIYVCMHICIYACMYKYMCISCFYKLWLLHLLHTLSCLRHFKSPGLIVFHMWFIQELIHAGWDALTAHTLDRPLFLSLFVRCTALGLRQVAITYKWPAVKLH